MTYAISVCTVHVPILTYVITLAAFNVKRNVSSVSRPSVCLTVSPVFSNLNRARGVFFRTLIGRALRTQFDSVGAARDRPAYISVTVRVLQGWTYMSYRSLNVYKMT